MSKKVNVRIEYGSTPIRSWSIQCPHCNRWFDMDDVKSDNGLAIEEEWELFLANLHCPHNDCGDIIIHDRMTNDEINIIECNNSKEVYKNVVRKKEIWT